MMVAHLLHAAPDVVEHVDDFCTGVRWIGNAVVRVWREDVIL